MVFEDLVKVLTSDHEEINVGEGPHCGVTWHMVDQTLLSEVLSLLQHLQDGVRVVVDQLNLTCKEGIGGWTEERLQVNEYMHVSIYVYIYICTYIYIRTCTIRVYTNIKTCAYTLTVYNNLELRTTNLSMVDEVDSKPDVSFLQNVLPRQEDEGLDHEGEVPQEWGLDVSEYRDLPGRTMMC